MNYIATGFIIMVCLTLIATKKKNQRLRDRFFKTCALYSKEPCSELNLKSQIGKTFVENTHQSTFLAFNVVSNAMQWLIKIVSSAEMASLRLLLMCLIILKLGRARPLNEEGKYVVKIQSKFSQNSATY